MKTTRAQFATFQQSFLYWQKELGMMDYSVTIEHVKISPRRFAQIHINHEGRGATVAFNTHLGDDLADPKSQIDPACSGKHEAIHLLLSRLMSLACSRYVIEREIEDAEEGIVRVLERLLHENQPVQMSLNHKLPSAADVRGIFTKGKKP
jgi:hypothetical protein